MMIPAIFMRDDDARANAMWQQMGSSRGVGTMRFAPTAMRPKITRWSTREGPRPIGASRRVWLVGCEEIFRERLGSGHSPPSMAVRMSSRTSKRLIGLARVRLGDWTGAEAAWIRAARMQRFATS